MTWANCNSMSCDRNKCKELVIKKKGNSTFYPVVRNIPQHATLDLLGLTFQNDCKFSAHIKAKLCKANKCLHVLRVCREERYSQTEIDYLLYSIALPNLRTTCFWCLHEQFLDRCYKLPRHQLGQIASKIFSGKYTSFAYILFSFFLNTANRVLINPGSLFHSPSERFSSPQF